MLKLQAAAEKIFVGSKGCMKPSNLGDYRKQTVLLYAKQYIKDICQYELTDSELWLLSSINELVFEIHGDCLLKEAKNIAQETFDIFGACKSSILK